MTQSVSSVRGHTRGPRRLLPVGLLALLGAGIGSLALSYLFTHRDPTAWWRVEFLTVVALSTSVLLGADRLVESEYGVADLWLILGWTVAGTGV